MGNEEQRIHHFQEILAITTGSRAGPPEEQDEIKNPAIPCFRVGRGRERDEDLKIEDPGATYRRAGE